MAQFVEENPAIPRATLHNAMAQQMQNLGQHYSSAYFTVDLPITKPGPSSITAVNPFL